MLVSDLAGTLAGQLEQSQGKSEHLHYATQLLRRLTGYIPSLVVNLYFKNGHKSVDFPKGETILPDLACL
jgi:hypothetical protein